MEFLQQAKSIVQRHEQLKLAVASLQQTLVYLESRPVCHIYNCFFTWVQQFGIDSHRLMMHFP